MKFTTVELELVTVRNFTEEQRQLLTEVFKKFLALREQAHVSFKFLESQTGG